MLRTQRIGSTRSRCSPGSNATPSFSFLFECSLSGPQSIRGACRHPLRRSLRSLRVNVANVPVLERQTHQVGSTAEVKPEGQLDNVSEKFVWTRHWWPIAPVNTLDTERPTKHVILGKPLAIWYNKSLGRFCAHEDRCPHRLAPLSQGRIIDDNLMCSYHGWKFDSSGRCTSIPQLSEQSQVLACSNQRSCAVSYPTFEHLGVLYAWMDPSPEGMKHAQENGITVLEGASGFNHAQLAGDYSAWIEQGWDFTHANFLHQGVGGFKMEKTVPTTTPLPPIPADEKGGFYMEHMGYEKDTCDKVYKRRFIPPFTTCIAYPSIGGQLIAQFNIVPVSPGVCRSVSSFSFMPGNATPKLVTTYPLAKPNDASAEASAQQSSPSAKPAAAGSTLKTTTQDFSGLAPVSELPSVIYANATKTAEASQAAANDAKDGQSKEAKNSGLAKATAATRLFNLIRRLNLPHWVLLNGLITDQDQVIMAETDRLVLQQGIKDRKYHLPATQADAGVAAVNKWFEKVEYPQSLFPPHLKQFTADWADGSQVDVDKLLARGPSHVDFCVVCQKGLRLMTKICWAVTAAAALTAGFAVNLAALGVIKAGNILAGDVPLLVSSIMAVGLAKAAQLLWDFRHERFISGGRQWRRKGGLSLVSVPDAV